MSEEEFLDEMLTEAGDLVALNENVETALKSATSVECMEDMLANLDDAKHALDDLRKELDAAHKRAKKFIQAKGK